MNSHKILLPLLLALASCKTSNPQASKLNQVYPGGSIDAIVMNSNLVNARDECRYHVLNFFGNSFVEGLMRNGAMQGIGTDNPAALGRSNVADSLYFQMLRVTSIADWEMQQMLNEPKKTGCLLDNLSINFGVLPIAYAEKLPHPFPGEVRKLQKAAMVIDPALGDFVVGEINGMENPVVWPKQSSLPPDYQAALQKGVTDKIRFSQGANNPSLSPLQKAKAMAASYTPYNISLNAKLLEGRPKESKLYVEAYLPPFYELETPDEKRVETWKLKPGLKRTELPKQVDISVAKLTHIGYMYDAETSQNPIIKMQMYKDFNDPNRLRTRIIFGRVDPNGTERGSIPMNFKNYRDALYVAFYPNMAEKPGDNAIVKTFKKQFNDIANQWKVDARIHQLTLNLERKPNGPDGASALIMRPKFSLKDSDISFRMHRYTRDGLEITSLRNVGFTCEGSGEVDCYQDFGAYTQLADFVNSEKGLAQGRLGSTIADRFKGWFNSIVRQNVKWIIDWNITTIEEAIDAEFMQIFQDLVAEQDENNAKIKARLEEALFKTE